MKNLEKYEAGNYLRLRSTKFDENWEFVVLVMKVQGKEDDNFFSGIIVKANEWSLNKKGYISHTWTINEESDMDEVWEQVEFDHHNHIVDLFTTGNIITPVSEDDDVVLTVIKGDYKLESDNQTYFSGVVVKSEYPRDIGRIMHYFLREIKDWKKYKI